MEKKILLTSYIKQISKEYYCISAVFGLAVGFIFYYIKEVCKDVDTKIQFYNYSNTFHTIGKITYTIY